MPRSAWCTAGCPLPSPRPRSTRYAHSDSYSCRKGLHSARAQAAAPTLTITLRNASALTLRLTVAPHLTRRTFCPSRLFPRASCCCARCAQLWPHRAATLVHAGCNPTRPGLQPLITQVRFDWHHKSQPALRVRARPAPVQQAACRPVEHPFASRVHLVCISVLYHAVTCHAPSPLWGRHRSSSRGEGSTLRSTLRAVSTSAVPPPCGCGLISQAYTKAYTLEQAVGSFAEELLDRIASSEAASVAMAAAWRHRMRRETCPEIVAQMARQATGTPQTETTAGTGAEPPSAPVALRPAPAPAAQSRTAAGTDTGTGTGTGTGAAAAAVRGCPPTYAAVLRLLREADASGAWSLRSLG